MVRPLGKAVEGKAKKYRIETLRKGWFWAERRWRK